MRDVLDRELLFVTGKGGVGKTTMAAAFGLLAARGGRRTIVVEVGQQSRLPALFGVAPAAPGMRTRLGEGLSSITVDPDRALLEWLQHLGGRISGRILASSGTFQYFAAAAPGARELVTMVKLWQLARGRRGSPGELVVVDAPATGHALGMLRSPQTFGAIARVGPIARHTAEIGELLADPGRSDYLAVALGSEMAVTEALELQDGLRSTLSRDLAAVVVNGLLPRRFTAAEIERVGALGGGARPRTAATRPQGRTSPAQVTRAAVRAAREVHDRSRLQHGQVERLRRRGFEVLPVPFMWRAVIDLPAVQAIAERLSSRL